MGRPSRSAPPKCRDQRQKNRLVLWTGGGKEPDELRREFREGEGRLRIEKERGGGVADRQKRHQKRKV